ncbi:lycopene cyclase domain-containing protein [Cryptosporangium aurantiacum]|uniref:Lycopene cyclase domain-containing protein n=1 Tax=Cryptosporangium aurantiacum TaxID=134849 RepID=A0A1M7IL81_9ACTN|nr:lycopene cyclase domain-containing protein [Cryptosporangium aurantiacum]SHM41157.1 lycopene cyclase domain-containing protein [Cryptosporangium aurantiacum]
MTYTQAAVLGVVVALVVDLFVWRTRLITRRVWWVSYAIVMFFQLLTNGFLTGRRIVQYDPDAILGDGGPQLFGDGRIVYAPVEDLLFGFALVLFAVSTWVRLGRRSGGRARPEPAQEPRPRPGGRR